jgi:hypothetical protein
MARTFFSAGDSGLGGASFQGRSLANSWYSSLVMALLSRQGVRQARKKAIVVSKPIHGDFTSWVGESAVFPWAAGVAALFFWLPNHFFAAS